MGDIDRDDAPFAELHETHSAVVVLLGPTAYKLKKPVTLPFLDFSTLEARLAACRREIELNRRLAPDVYLGLSTLSRPGADPEPVIVMRRMPDARRLTHLVTAGAAGSSQIRAVARLMASFHARAARSDEIAAAGSRDAVALRWQHNLDEAADLEQALPAATVAAVRRLSGRYLAGRGPLFAQRIARGCVVDGHGDLLADDIFCLDDGPRVLDCLDFDDALRWMDQLDDVACLAMDLERLGRADLGLELMGCYREYGADTAPTSLGHHYIAYRAFMRAKVAAIRREQTHAACQPGPLAVEDPAELAELALQHLRAGAVRLILVGGAPGTGKSTVADAIGARVDASVLSSDRIRKELAGIDPLRHAGAAFEEGIYTPEWTARTYAELLRRAEQLLGLGESVILDASWRSAAGRDAAARVAQRTASDLHELRCRLPAAVAAGRLRARCGISDADPEIAAAMRQAESPWPGSMPIDTSVEVGDAVQAAVAAILGPPR